MYFRNHVILLSNLCFLFFIFNLYFLYLLYLNDENIELQKNREIISNLLKRVKPISSYNNQCNNTVKNVDLIVNNEYVTIDAIDHLRRSESIAQEIFNYVSVKINRTELLNDSIKSEIIQQVGDIKNVLQLELGKANHLMKINKFKQLKLTELSKIIQTKISELQNPDKNLCKLVPKLICKLTVDAGFASGIHEIIWCMISAYYSNQTVILIADWEKYFKRTPDVWERLFLPFFNLSRESWDSIFMPLSNTCNYFDVDSKQLVEIERPNNVFARRLMNQLPKNIGPQLVKLVENPNSWFHSQFTGYIMRPQKRLQQHLIDYKKQINYKHPIVGIQVRRTDKLIREASYHNLSDYMVHINDYYSKLALTQVITERLVYVASDEPTVLPNLISQYPAYRFIGSTQISKIASQQSTRYSNASLWGILTDVFLLSETDYIVCTFSSAICRLSYQLMSYSTDSFNKIHSLDVPFHYHHSLTPPKIAQYNHYPLSDNQWNLKIGSRLHEKINRHRQTEWFDQAVNGRSWDSFFFATNTTFNQNFYKLYPIYKMRDEITFI